MIEQDTIRLLRECDSGAKMGVSAIEDVIEGVSGQKFKKLLEKAKSDHQKLQDDLQILLDKYHDDGKDPNPMAKSMSWLKTNVMLTMDNSDETIADLMTDGCDMGIKSLSKYLNKYEAADEKSKDLAKWLITIEEDMRLGMQEFL